MTDLYYIFMNKLYIIGVFSMCFIIMNLSSCCMYDRCRASVRFTVVLLIRKIKNK